MLKINTKLNKQLRLNKVRKIVFISLTLLFLCAPIVVSALQSPQKRNNSDLHKSSSHDQVTNDQKNPNTIQDVAQPTTAPPNSSQDSPSPSSTEPTQSKPSQASTPQSKAGNTTSAVTPSPQTAAPDSNKLPVANGVDSSLNFINTLRQEVGKPALLLNQTMSGWALNHAQFLATNCKLEHQNLNQFLNVNIGPVSTSAIAENVGYAGSTQAVLQGLKNSPGHYANMTGDYTYVGISVVTASGGACTGDTYTVQLFAR